MLDGEPHGRLRWELTPDGDGTLLSFRSTVELEGRFLTMVPAGWHFHLDALAEHLEGGARDLAGVDGWEPIHAAYEAKPGPTLFEAQRNRRVSLYVLKP